MALTLYGMFCPKKKIFKTIHHVLSHAITLPFKESHHFLSKIRAHPPKACQDPPTGLETVQTRKISNVNLGKIVAQLSAHLVTDMVGFIALSPVL
ncbi:hypothetical protein TNCT_352491 [Trichonephila clavata]|uniref:Uncharacterized protein n=1 Tax=Trichonephila clavata TaxID=2740835 RepID=A0A8X6G3P1_TRICU|nr:hypothetical protein TNCT_352491 [Trichonephila clavata]